MCCLIKYFLLVLALENHLIPLKILTEIALPFTFKVSLSFCVIGAARSRQNFFLALLNEAIIDPLGKILKKEGELSMRCRQECRIFPMLGKEGL